MAFEKQDSFSPNRSTNVDGFFTRAPEEQQHKPKNHHAPAKQQPLPVSLRDMPKRSESQPILASASSAGAIVATPEGHKKHKRHPYRSGKRLFKRARLVLGIGLLLGCCLLGFKIYKDVTKFTSNHSVTAQHLKSW